MKNIIMLSFICCMKRDKKEVCALDANKLEMKILEMLLGIITVMELYQKIDTKEGLSLGDAIRLKELLGLSNLEAADIFLS